mgnify:CR=1 FL=1
MRGFTFIELLIVLGLITALISIFIYFINPVEILKKHRDIQRMNDLKALEIAINTYISSNPYADLDGYFDNTGKGESFQSIYVSVPVDKELIPFATITDGLGNIWNIIQNSSSTNLRNIDGTGWLPINFTEMKYYPISYLPVDPLNSYNLGYFYTYVFDRKTKTFELNAKLEYKIFNKGEAQDVVSKDGGSDNEVYETGSNKCIIIGNNLYGTISTTTCKEYTENYGIQTNYGKCSISSELNYGIWLLTPSEQDVSSIVHDKNTSTYVYISPGPPVTTVIHNLQAIYYLEKVRIYGNSPFAVGINIYKDNQPVLVTTTFLLGWHEFQINTTTDKWEITPGEGTSTISEMAAYGCPIYWSKYFESGTIVYDIKRSKESNNYYYIIAGSKSNDFWIAKLNSEGVVKFATSFGGSDFDIFYSIDTEDANNDGFIDYYILSGYTKSYGIGAPISSNGYIVKIATSGNIIYQQSYGSTSDDYIKEVKNSNNYYFTIGDFRDPVSTTTNLWFLRISSSTGSVIDERILGGTSETKGNSLLSLDTSTILVSGRQLKNSYIAKIDLNSTDLLFEKNYSTASSTEEIIKLIPDKASNQILALVKIFDENYQRYYFQVRRINTFDGSYSVLVNYNQFPLNEVPYDFIQDDNGDIVVSGYSQYCTGICLPPKLTIYKFKIDGKFVFKKEYDQGIGYSIEKAFPPGYIVGGYSYKTNSGWVMYVDQNGECLNCFAKSSWFINLANIFDIILRFLKFLP